IGRKKVSFVLDADIRSFFDEIDQQWLIRFLEHRIGDKRIIRLVQKWLKAGVLEDGVVSVSASIVVRGVSFRLFRKNASGFQARTTPGGYTPRVGSQRKRNLYPHTPDDATISSVFSAI